MHPLDNPVWHALTGPHAHLAETAAQAARYDVDVAPFVAVPDEPDGSAWTDLASLVGVGGIAVLFRDVVVPPDGWEVLGRFPTVQLVWPGAEPPAGPPVEVVPLGGADVDAMLDLVNRTQPGPFLPRTVELGGYLGVRAGGRLVAMAGHRFRVPGHTEISAVCTEPELRRQGLAAALCHHVTAIILDRGETPFLHVLIENAAALALYERLGFEHRRNVDVAILRAPG